MRSRRLALVALLVAAGTAEAAPRSRWFERVGEERGYAFPRHALWDPDAGHFLLLESNGYPGGRGQDGMLSLVGPRGRSRRRGLTRAEGRPGLEGAAAVARRGAIVFVADGPLLRRFHRETGAPLGSFDLAPAGAVTLGSLALGADGRTLIAGDLDAGLVLTHDPGRGTREVLARDLGRVLGVAPHPTEDAVLALAYDAPGRASRLLRLGPTGSPPAELGRYPDRRLTGLGPDGVGGLLVVDPTAGEVLTIRPDEGWALTSPIHGFHRPTAVASGPEGALLVLEEGGRLHAMARREAPLPPPAAPGPSGGSAPAVPLTAPPSLGSGLPLVAPPVPPEEGQR